MEDIPYGSEPSFAYGPEFWSLKLSFLSADARRACVLKYRLSDVTLASLGLTALGHEPPEPLPRKLGQSTLDHWYETSPAPDTTKTANPSTASQVQEQDTTADQRPWAKGKLLVESPPPDSATSPPESATTKLKAAGLHQGRAALGHGLAPGSRSLGTGELENEKALCGEDDLSCLPAVQTPPMLAEHSSPISSTHPQRTLPPTALPWPAQESPHAGDRLGLGDLENKEALSPAAAQDPETLGLGTERRRLLGWGELDHEGTLRSEDDSRLRTHTILAESPPPPPATRHTGSKSMALWDKGLLSASVTSAQESPHEGDQLGMGDLATEEALCRLDDSHLRTHPMLAVPPPPLPASPPANSLATDAPLPMIHSNPGDSQVNELAGSGIGGQGPCPMIVQGVWRGPA